MWDLSLRVLRAATLASLVGIVGCGKPQRGADPASGDRPTDVLKIGMSQCNLEEPRLKQMNADVKAAADKHENLEVVFKDARNDTLKQCKHIDQFVADKVDLIIIHPKEAQPLTRPVAEAYQAGIPVIVLDRAVIGDQYTCFLAADNKKIGEAAGSWLAKQLGGKGKIVEMKGPVDSARVRDRDTGFRVALRDYPDIRTLLEVDMKWLEPSARQQMESALAKLTDIDAVYAHNDLGAHGAYLAAKAAGREKDIVFVGIGALPEEGVADVAQGILDASFEYPTGGAEAIDTALKVLAGQEVPKTIVLKSKYFTKDNVDQGGEPIE